MSTALVKVRLGCRERGSVRLLIDRGLCDAQALVDAYTPKLEALGECDD